MLFFRELKKVCFSMVYVVFLGLLLFSWYENFYGVTEQEIKAAKNGAISAQTGRMEPSILRKPSKEDTYYGSKQGDGNPERIMMGAADWMYIEYRSNSYATYPYGYYKEVKKDSFPTVNGNIFHSGTGSLAEDGSYVIEQGKSETVQFCEQVSYERFWELMKQAEGMIGRGSNYSMENLKL